MENTQNIDFKALLTEYQSNLAQLRTAEKPTIEQIVVVLYSRDAIDEARRTGQEFSEALLNKLVDLDEELRLCEQVITDHPKFETSRQTVNPSDAAWWWFFTGKEAAVEESTSFWQAIRQSWFQYDWFWNTLTVACLVGAGSYAANTAQAFSNENLDLLQKFTTISQGAGLALVTGGTLTKRGQKVIAEGLSNMGIKPKYQAEVTCGFAALLFTATWGLNQSIPLIGKLYYDHGLQRYRAGDVTSALKNYERAQALDPENSEIQISLGDLYATFSRYAEAQEQYRFALSSGVPSAFNGLGRALFRQATSTEDLVDSISVFRLGIAKEQQPSFLRSIMYGHLGFVYIRSVEVGEDLNEEDARTLYREANLALRESIAIEQRKIRQLERAHNLDYDGLSEAGYVESGTGMSYCYMGILYDKLQAATIPLETIQLHRQRGETADYFWELCRERALPTSLSQYKDITTHADQEIVQGIEVEKIVQTPADSLDQKLEGESPSTSPSTEIEEESSTEAE